MSLQDLRFISSSGEVITGRLPAQLRTDGPLTDEQLARVAHLYDIFLANKLAAIGGDEYFVMNKVVDGLAVRMISIRNVDTVTVRGAAKGHLDLPHGFAVRANWYRPFIYRRKPTNPPQWSLDGVIVPQAEWPIAVDSQAFIAGDKRLCHPLVRPTGRNKYWDWSQHSFAAYPDKAYPFALKVGTSYSARQVFAAYDDKVYSRGVEVHTTTASAPILSLDPESPAYLEPDTSADGSYLLMNHVRQAVVSESAGISWMRFAAERIKRNSEGRVVKDTGTVSSLVVPHPVNSLPIQVEPGLGEDLSDKVWMNHNYIAFVGASWDLSGGSGPMLSAFVGWTEVELPSTRENSYVQFDEAQRDVIVADSIAVHTSGTLLKLPTHNGSTDITLQQHPDYPTRMFWRGGTKAQHAAINYDYLFPSGYYGIEQFHAKRIDMECSQRGNPRCTLKLGWDDFVAFSGVTVGDFDGTKHVDDYVPKATGLIWSYAYSVTWVTPVGAGNLPGNTSEWAEFCARNDIRESICVPIAAKYYTTLHNVEVLKDKRPVNTGSYSFTSRHIIDYDHKARFWAAIEVTVTCAGAIWKESGAYEGAMGEYQLPGYDVTIKFVWKWQNPDTDAFITGSQTLATASATRRPLEFLTLTRWNPYYYGTPFENINPVYVRLPPMISMPLEAMQQIKTLAKHQGFNSSLAAEDYRQDLSDAQYLQARSSRGIEFSRVASDGSAGLPHRNFVTGMLYARTFRLADFPEALWLLTKTRCDMKLNGNDADELQPNWYYMSALKNTIDNTKFHIELRDGVLVQWSDEIPLGFGAAPDAEDREISLHRV